MSVKQLNVGFTGADSLTNIDKYQLDISFCLLFCKKKKSRTTKPYNNKVLKTTLTFSRYFNSWLINTKNIYHIAFNLKKNQLLQSEFISPNFPLLNHNIEALSSSKRNFKPIKAA